ncbi:Type I restriction-modification system methyltransferase subunit [Neisseria zoodegmatis]|uniref:site-specific DNA-methyltransferase (adenine-specific) n=1 Tax=Neisseria zoodegmatis TaxID=326523 RepID=A0A378WTS7_9NEIS|nr:Eco57I restriction-modification methylase domain-containing protein [Neisseria zoodegmatis]SUA43854.1 Type I restriction-modification system methyltransferase subunit [Neisseria zoodegmatis]
MSSFLKTHYNPDVLTCLASLSNDEVFTPPELVNQMLDRLPESLWRRSDARFLDPVCKSGVFLREIAKRLIEGLADEIPDLQERLNHIFTKQLYGIAITELTALLSRRSLYCAKHANGEYSVCTAFDHPQGNIRHGRTEHHWQNSKCGDCGASREVYDRGGESENHAYAFIHGNWAKRLWNTENMKFDVIIGNPPYQLSDGGAQASAAPIYHKFIQQAKKLNPDYLVMIVPSRWFAGGKGLDDFRDEMLNDKRMKEIHDFPNAADCFPGVEIKGGVNYFLWQKDYSGDCLVCTYENSNKISELKRPLQEPDAGVFLRYNEAIGIFRKVREKKESSFAEQISSRKPFGLTTNVKGNPNPYTCADNVLLYQNGGTAHIKRENIPMNRQWIDKHKVIMPYAVGSGDSKTDWVKPIYAAPQTACTETYLLVGPFDNKQICENVMSYINTRFFHFMLTLKKNTQHATKQAYEFVPMQDFSEKWTDKKLYEKYGLSEEERNYINAIVKPDMELEHD